jgi:hypothetical protein
MLAGFRFALVALSLVASIGAHAETVDGRRVVIIDGDTVAFGRSGCGSRT